MISVVIPVYNEEESVRELHRELVSVLDGLGAPSEIIFVDDGSTGGTLAALKALSPARVIAFARNFGKSQALMAGFRAASGEHVFTMDGDLQDDPHEMSNFLKAHAETGADLIVGWKQRRQDGAVKNLVSRFANSITRLLTGTSVHDMNCGFKLYQREAAAALDLSGDLHRYIPALLSMRGFRVIELPISHRRRRFGVSKYGNLRRLPKSFFDLVTLVLLQRFTDRPMHMFGIIGSALSLIGVMMLAYLSYLKLVLGETIGNRPLLLLGVLLVVIGIQLFSSGFLGELIIRQRSGRDAYTIREEAERS